MKVVVVGCTHAGTATVVNLKEMHPECDVTIYERNDNISFLSCGIALQVGGVIAEPKKLFYNSPEKLANDLFDNNLTARLSFIDRVKEAVPEPVQFDEIDASRQLKRFENQKLSLSNGIELIVPNNVYQDAESVEFIQNDNGTYSILIKNIEDIQNK